MHNINDFMHLYLKCWGTVYDSKHEKYKDGGWALSAELLSAVLLGECKFKPHLRKLSDLTTDEWNEMGRRVRTGQNIRTAGDLWKMNASETNYLLLQRFDLFDLIESGLAIEAKT